MKHHVDLPDTPHRAKGRTFRFCRIGSGGLSLMFLLAGTVQAGPVSAGIDAAITSQGATGKRSATTTQRAALSARSRQQASHRVDYGTVAQEASVTDSGWQTFEMPDFGSVGFDDSCPER